MTDYKGISRSLWPSTWSPTSTHPIVLSEEVRGGLQYLSGSTDSSLTDIPGTRLQEGMLVYLDSDASGNFEEKSYWQYQLLAGEERDAATGAVPNAVANWKKFDPRGLDSTSDLTLNSLTLRDRLKGPSTFYIDPLPLTTDSAGDSNGVDGIDSAGRDKGLVVILGDLEVRGTQTTVKSLTLTINDKNIVLADSARDSADADGGGITLAGANATMLYDDSSDTWNFNKGVTVRGDILPSLDSTYNLGSDSNRWKDLYLSGTTIYLGNLILKDDSGVLSFVDSANDDISFEANSATLTGDLIFKDDSGNLYTIGVNDSGDLNIDGNKILNTSSSIGDFSDVDITNIDSGGLLVWDDSAGEFTSRRTLPTLITFEEGIYTEKVSFKDSSVYFGDFATFSNLQNINTVMFTSVDSNAGFAVKSSNTLFLGLDNQKFLRTYDSGHIELYYNDIHRLETRNYGILVYGQVNADSAQFRGPLSADSSTFGGPVVINSTLTADSSTFDGPVVINNVLTADSAVFDGPVVINNTLTGDSATFDGPVVATSFTGEYLGFDSDLGDSDARQTIRSYFYATGGLGYDSATGVFTFNVESAYTKAAFDSDWNVALDEAAIGGTGLYFKADSNTLSIDSSELYAYYSTDNLSEGDSNRYYRRAYFDSDLGDSTSRQTIRGYFSATGGLGYDSATGVFTFDVESAYTKAAFDSDWNVALDSAAMGGTGLIFDSANNTLSIDSSELGYFKLPIRSYFSATGGLGYDSQTGVFTFDVESAYTKAAFDSDWNVALDEAAMGGFGLTFNADSNKLSIDSAELYSYFSTDNLSEGDSNLYYTSTRADSAFDVRFLTKTTDSLAEGDNLYYTTARADSAFDIKFLTKTTDSLAEGDNLYYTTARADSAFDIRFLTKTTDSLAEGDNLYYTTARVDSAFDIRFLTKTTDSLAEGDNLYYTTARVDSAFDIRFLTKTTDSLAEGDNLYYTTARVDSAFDVRFLTKTTDSLAEGDTNLYYTTARFDSDFNVAMDASGLAGNGLVYDADSNTISLDSTYNGVFNSLTNTTGATTTNPTGTLVTDGTVVVVDTEAHNSGYKSIEYVVHMDDSTNGHSQLSKVLVTYNATSVFYTEYGMVNSYTGDSDIGTLTADVSGADIRLKFQRSSGVGSVNVKPVKTVIS